MLRWLSVFTFLTLLSAAGSGCAPYHMGHRPYRPAAVCDPVHGTDTCGPTRPLHYGAACGTVGCDPCDPCGPCYYGEYSPFGPFAAIFRVFRPITWVGPSCGERYWGGYLSDPPDCYDPCDCYGNYTGMHVKNCPRRGGRVHAACVDHACAEPTCEPGCGVGGCPPSGGEYLGARQPSRPVSREPQYLGQHRPLVRPPVGTLSTAPDPASRFAPRVISVDDRVVGEGGPQPTAARRLEAVRR